MTAAAARPAFSPPEAGWGNDEVRTWADREIDGAFAAVLADSATGADLLDLVALGPQAMDDRLRALGIESGITRKRIAPKLRAVAAELDGQKGYIQAQWWHDAVDPRLHVIGAFAWIGFCLGFFKFRGAPWTRDCRIASNCLLCTALAFPVLGIGMWAASSPSFRAVFGVGILWSGASLLNFIVIGVYGVFVGFAVLMNVPVSMSATEVWRIVCQVVLMLWGALWVASLALGPSKGIALVVVGPFLLLAWSLLTRR